MNIGVQLYTLRDFCKTTEDFSETLKKVADIGYKYVQVSGTCDYDAVWLKKELDKNGLTCVLTHIGGTRFLDEADAIAKEHDVLDCKNIGLGYYNFSEEGFEKSYRKFMEIYKPVTDIFYEKQKYFMYHNHGFEFEKVAGKWILDHLADAISPEKMGFTLDTYWAQVAGADPAYCVEKYSGRVPAIHIKDCDFNQKMMPIGEGNINFDRVFEKASAAGTEYLLVEQDNCNGEDPFDCIARSYKYLKARGL